MRWARRRWLPEERSHRVVLALGLLAALYAWPVLAEASSPAGDRVDRFLRLAAATTVAVAGLSVSWRSQGRARSALLLLITGVQLWTVAQALLLARDVLALGGPAPAVDAAGTVALTGCSAVALWLLSGPRTRTQALQLLVEWSLVATSVVLLLRLAVPVLWQPGQAEADWARAGSAGVLLAAALLLGAGRGVASGSWTSLPYGLAAAGVALAVGGSASPGTAARLAGLLLAVCLVVVALLVADLDGDDRAQVADGVPGQRAQRAVAVWVIPAAAAAALVAHLLVLGRVDVLGLGGLVVVGLLAVAHGHLLRVQAHAQVLELHAREEGLRHRAFHDELTGLANRALFADRLTRALDLHRRHRLPVSVLYLDLDGFKDVNDRHGHPVGDAVLSELAARLQQCLRPEDILARMGGDEFAVLLEHASSSEAVEERLREALVPPVVVGDLRLVLRMSVGSARVGPADPTPSPEQVLADADAAMYSRKQRHEDARARRRRTPPARDDRARALAAGIAAAELSLVHQPLVDAGTGEVHGTEALVRWWHDGQLQLPGSFVELADRSGLSGALLDAVLAQACEQLATWSRTLGHDRLSAWVNVSPAQLQEPDVADRVRAAVQAHGLRPHQVVLETDVASLEQLPADDRLLAAGPPLALAGFTGRPEELSLLRAPAVRAVKVTGSHLFDADRRLHVLAALAPELDVQVVVERVQRRDELTALRTLHGVLGQGYALSRPAAAVDLDPVVLGRAPLPV